VRVGATRQRVQAGGQAANATVVVGHDPRPARHPPLPLVRLRRSVAPPVFPHARAPHRPLCHEKGPRGGSRRGLRAAARGRRPPVRRPTAERRASGAPRTAADSRPRGAVASANGWGRGGAGGGVHLSRFHAVAGWRSAKARCLRTAVEHAARQPEAGRHRPGAAPR